MFDDKKYIRGEVHTGMIDQKTYVEINLHLELS